MKAYRLSRVYHKRRHQASRHMDSNGKRIPHEKPRPPALIINHGLKHIELLQYRDTYNEGAWRIDLSYGSAL